MQDTIICYLQETQFKYNDTKKLKVWKKIYHANTNIAGMAILIPKYISEQRKLSDMTCHFYHDKGAIHQEDTIILNVYVSNNL